MKDQIQALHRLQTQDRRLVTIERKLASIPRAKQEMERDLAKLETMLRSEVEKLGDSRSFRMDQERQLDDERDQIRSGKARISQVKNSRELTAAQRELDSTRRLSESRQSEITRIDEAISEAEGRIQGMEGGLTELRSSVTSERARLDELETKLTLNYKKARRKPRGPDRADRKDAAASLRASARERRWDRLRGRARAQVHRLQDGGRTPDLRLAAQRRDHPAV